MPFAICAAALREPTALAIKHGRLARKETVVALVEQVEQSGFHPSQRASSSPGNGCRHRTTDMAKKPKRRDKSAAVITIKSPSRMTKRGRKDIADWLRRHATMLVKDGDKYTNGRFTGRFIYT